MVAECLPRCALRPTEGLGWSEGPSLGILQALNYEMKRNGWEYLTLKYTVARALSSRVYEFHDR